MRTTSMLPSVDIQCPYCGETIDVVVDDSAGDQSYIEDCQVCCRPIVLTLTFADDGEVEVAARAENDA
ncbi:CPXCG motif-containing cysteine-rich protein [Cognatiluteimonas profundi]|uniref:CPXCG motif-containing cysteine-rich protein n=1 Tax=Cognatiluteimonas profundi TaxID=2594501 RepID=UPI001E636C5A|nr:CPXCG motif-containing cysteine-rich protein [Lysobacter profundi]